MVPGAGIARWRQRFGSVPGLRRETGREGGPSDAQNLSVVGFDRDRPYQLHSLRETCESARKQKAQIAATRAGLL